jgi:CelD/BcsL family acetyltransferase involved in cellulose biosynthesis
LKKKVAKVLREDHPKNAFKKFKTAQEIDMFLKLASVVSAKTYQHRLFNRGIPDNSRFCVHARKQAELGLVRGYLLYVDATPVAYTYVPAVNEGILLYDYNGYDPDYSRLSPGTVLQFKIIEDLCSDPEVMIYDLCTGEDDAKTLFSTDSKYCADILILKKSLKNFLIITSHAAITSFSKVIGRFLSRLNLKNRLKRYIRRNAGAMESQVET